MLLYNHRIRIYIKRNPLRGTRTVNNIRQAHGCTYIKRNPLRGTRTEV